MQWNAMLSLPMKWISRAPSSPRLRIQYLRHPSGFHSIVEEM